MDLSPCLGRGLGAPSGSAYASGFGEPPVAVDYVGEFDDRARQLAGPPSWLSSASCSEHPLFREPACASRRLFTSVQPACGVAWNREYRWPNGRACLVRSTKIIDSRGGLVERLPARLCMPLNVYEQRGVLHFVSRGYYFDLWKASER